MTASLIPSPVMQFTDATGAPLVGGKVYTYAAGTTTPLASYTSYAATSSNTNPVILDSRGEAAIWFGNASYKVILKDSTDTLIWTSDNISVVVPMAYVAPGTANNLLQSNGSAWASVAPSTITVGNATAAASVPLSGVTGLGTGVSTFLATPSSANLAAALTDETGSGSAVFATSPTLNSPTLITPALGTPSSGDLSNCTGSPGGITIGTTYTTTGGTSAQITGISATAKRVTIVLNGVSTNGASQYTLKIGPSGGVVSTGYSSIAMSSNPDASLSTLTSAFILMGTAPAAADTFIATIVLNSIGGNVWALTSQGYLTNGVLMTNSTGSITLAGALERVSLTTSGGVNTFDAMSMTVNVE